MRHLWLFGLLLLLSLPACAPKGAELTGAGELRSTKYVDGQGKTGVSGKVFLKKNGEALQGAYVNIYPNNLSNLLGPSQFISSPTDAAGHYRIEVPPGSYYVVARKRSTGLGSGPLAPGDFFSEHQRILAVVKSGQFSLVDLPMATMTAPMFFKKGLSETRTDTGIRGVLVDNSGQPVPGGFAIAYRDTEMQRLPDFASTLTNEKGEFTLYLPEGGAYYLAARIHAWDMPRPGEPYGKYGGEPPQAIRVPNRSFVEGIRIEMHPFSGVYKEGKSQRPF